MEMRKSAVSKGLQTTVTHQEYIKLAIPLIIAGISTPLIGAVDTAVVGRMPDPVGIGAVSIGAVIFNTIYWLLGFLRVSTTGLTAQAIGANDKEESALSFLRPMAIALGIGLIFIILQGPILYVSQKLLGIQSEIESLTSAYFSIRIWGAPFALLNYVLIGWLMGLGKVKLSLATQVYMNICNILLDLLFVLGFGMGVAGVAIATLIAEVSTVFIGLYFVLKMKQIDISSVRWKLILKKDAFMKMLILNRDLFLRSICLLTMTGVFTAMSARMDEVALAANSILLQIHYIIAYLIGGFGNASSILIGKSIGSQQKTLFKRTLSLSFIWGAISAGVLALVVLLFGEQLLSFFTNIQEVRIQAASLLIWMVVYPIVGFWNLQLEGVFSGAAEAKYVRNSIFMALIMFLVYTFAVQSAMTPHQLWLSFIIFTLGRSLFLAMSVGKLERLKFK
ncbi:MATE family efflux transporter [Cytobacillus gottheilii]|uniref:MATE family efflux transporter n=1 Tax=Cytobacillus gottheilii TaxID=859144 RepID=UPI002494F8E3|nr:MATE family efflux transporter [Cytobacillus gottheilii]